MEGIIMKPGYIEITDKVRFVFHELKIPDKKTYEKAKLYNFENLIIQKYEASKRTVEVSNKIQSLKTKKIRWIWLLNADNNWTRFKNNQPCKAEVTDNEAIITKLS